MSATIIPLPGAATAPVRTALLRSGRPPSGVVSIRRGRQLRIRRKWGEDRSAQLHAQARAVREWADGFAQGYADAIHEEAARLDAQALALRQRGW